MRADDGRLVDLDAPHGESLSPRSVRPAVSSRRAGELVFDIPSLERKLYFRYSGEGYRLLGSAVPAAGH
jgi:hypothetical protein